MTATDSAGRFLLAYLEMNAEVGFLVFILYFYLFLDLYSSFEKLLHANGVDYAKNSWQFKRQKNFERKNLATFKKDDRKTDLPEMSFYHEMWQPRARDYGERMVSVQKSRLWGRG